MSTQVPTGLVAIESVGNPNNFFSPRINSPVPWDLVGLDTDSLTYNEFWIVERVGGPESQTYTIQHPNTHKYLRIIDNQPMVDNEGPDNLWDIVAESNGVYKIEADGVGTACSLPDPQKSNVIVLQSYSAAPYQQWSIFDRFKVAPDGK